MAAVVHRQSAAPRLRRLPHLWIARSVGMTKTPAASETHRVLAAAVGASTRKQVRPDDTVDLDIVKISKRLGYAKPSVTLAICAHMFTTHDIKAAAAINAALSVSGERPVAKR